VILERLTYFISRPFLVLCQRLKQGLIRSEAMWETCFYKEVSMNKKYIVWLSDAERQVCVKMVKELKGSSQEARGAQILLKADADGPVWTDEKISEAFGYRVQTVESIRKRLVTESFELALEGRKRQTPPTPPILNGEAEAKVIAMRLGKPPAG